jgi:hypothetical protein
MAIVKRALLFGALWMAATVVTGAVAWGAVRLAGEQTADQAIQPMSARQVEALAASAVTSTTAATTPSTTLFGTTLATTTTMPSGPTTGAASSTTAGPEVVARQTRGGTVVVSLQSGSLTLVSAAPASGYSVEVEESGPEEVTVAFEGGEDDEVRVRAFISVGEVVFEVREGGEAD